MPAVRSKVVSKHMISRFLPKDLLLSHVSESTTSNASKLFSSLLLRCYSSFYGGSGRKAVRIEEATHSSAMNDCLNPNPDCQSGFYNADDYRSKEDGRISYKSHHNPPNPIPNRPLREDKRSYGRPDDISHTKFIHRKNDRDYGRGDEKAAATNVSPHYSQPNSPMFGGGNRDHPQSRGGLSIEKLNDIDDISDGKRMDDEDRKMTKSSRLQFLNKPLVGKEIDNQFSKDDFLEKFKLGADKKEKLPQNPTTQLKEKLEKISGDTEMLEPQPQDADEIFKKMKENGLIPNAVAMLDGLCKDGLVQEAMKLFGLMREKGTFPEVVIYTAVVEGFCKAQKLDDAKRIFRKMQNNGISPNAFSYNVFIQGLCKGKRLEDAVEFCVEMLEAGHSPNVTTFVDLVHCFCKEKGVEETQSVIERLRQKGYFADEKAVREYLNKKGPFLPLIWEAIFGKKSSQSII